jgi:hypothetical protein
MARIRLRTKGSVETDVRVSRELKELGELRN